VIFRRLTTVLAALAALVVASTAVVVVSAPASEAALRRTGSVPVAPHTNVAAIYDLFGLRHDDNQTLDSVAGDLQDEGYEIERYTDSTEGAGSHGTATLANFAAMAKRASVIVINGHGYDPTKEVQSCVDGKGFVGHDEPVATTTSTKPGTQACSELDQPILQFEWYPTLDAGKAARKKYVAQGYKNDWFAGPFLASTNIDFRNGDEPQLDENDDPAPERGGRRAGLFMTASGIAHFFGDKQLDIVDLMACQTMALAPAFDARTFFGHDRTACTNKEAHDEPELFSRLTGHSGVDARATTKAFELGGFDDQYFKMAETSKDVVLSPAVVEASPGDGGGVEGTTTPVSIQFDAQMVDTPPKSVVTASGCGASIAGAKWANDDRFSFDVKVPKIQPGKTMTLTVHHDAAKSAGGYPHVLDGNQDPGAAGESGVAPNGDDYVWHLSCAPSTKFKMVYAGTYEYTYNQTASGLPPTDETGSYTWTQTQIIDVSSPSPYNSQYESTTTLDASGSSTLDGNDLHVSCTIQTPGGYQWVSKRTGGKYKDGAPISFSWSIATPPRPGTGGATGGGGGAPSGCTSDGDFTESYGLPEPTAHGEQTAIDESQAATLLDALSGSASFPAGKLPQTKHFDVEGERTVTEGATNTAKLSFHGTLTFSRL
jgi:hypothetical protein